MSRNRSAVGALRGAAGAKAVGRHSHATHAQVRVGPGSAVAVLPEGSWPTRSTACTTSCRRGLEGLA
ncbi:hypothetical protein [Actinoplanes sp. NPDC048796]|uniref:hypothetical protein n=1 Tax=unclassified Actinoplanes TaxID=2626549 RepID=UPI00340E83BA